MADTKITGLVTGTTIHSDDWLVFVDTHDTTMAVTGSDKKVSPANVLAGMGTIGASQLPNPSSSTLGGVQSAAAVSHQWINSISTSGVPSLSQPAFTDISGTVAASQLPNPSSSTLGGVQSAAAVTHQWIDSISTAGVPHLSQPAFSDISGTVGSGQLAFSLPLSVANGGSGSTSGAPGSHSFGVSGTPALNDVSPPIFLDRSCTCDGLTIACATAPSGGSLTVQIQTSTDGTTWGSLTSGAVSATTGTYSGTAACTTAISANTYVRGKFTAVNGAANATCILFIRS